MNFELDKTGFPMIWVDECSAYLHWLPMTKVQFEYFLCDSPGSSFNEDWYNEVLDLNGRISPKQARKRNYWQLLLTGINPDEVKLVVEWFGDDYRIPTDQEWNQIYRSFKAKKPLDNPFATLKVNQRCRAILEKIDQITKTIHRKRQRTLADQMLMRWGVMEWVERDYGGEEWGGMGQTHSGLYSTMRTPDGTPETLNDPLGIRLHYFGFRLLRR